MIRSSPKLKFTASVSIPFPRSIIAPMINMSKTRCKFLEAKLFSYLQQVSLDAEKTVAVVKTRLGCFDACILSEQLQQQMRIWQI